MKCPDCGAPITDESRFCSHCGAKLDDGVKRTEININKRIEDVAEIKRADYEEAESRIRQRKEEAKVKQNKVRHWTCYILIALSAISWIYVAFNAKTPGSTGLLIIICLFAIEGPFVLGYMIYQLVTGKW